MQLRQKGSFVAKSRSPNQQSTGRDRSHFASRASSTANNESLDQRKNSTLVEAKKEAQLVKQSLMSARQFMKNESQKASGKTENSLVDRTNTQLNQSQTQYNSFAKLQSRKSTDSLGKKHNNSMINSRVKVNNQNSSINISLDPSGKKKKNKSPRQVQIEFLENDEFERLRKEASLEKRSQIIDDLSQIMTKQPNLKIDSDLLKDLKKFDSQPYQHNQTERPPIKKIQINDLNQKKAIKEYVEPLSASNISKTQKNELNVEPVSASLELFTSIFGEAFEKASIEKRSGRLYITKSQYEQAINMLSDNSAGRSQASSKRDAAPEPDINEQRSHLLGLYKRADRGKLGIIFKDDLIQVLKDDLVRVYQQSEYNDLESIRSQGSHISKRSQQFDLEQTKRSTLRESRAESFVFQTDAINEGLQDLKAERDETPKMMQGMKINDQQSPVEMITPYRKKRANRLQNKSRHNEEENQEMQEGDEIFSQIIQSQKYQQQNGVRVNDFPISDQKNSREIQLIKKQSSNSSKKSGQIERNQEKVLKQNYITESPKKASRGQFKDFDDYGSSLKKHSGQKTLDDFDQNNRQNTNIQKQSSEAVPKPKNQIYRQQTTSSRQLSYKDLQRSTYLGALDLLNIQGQQPSDRQQHLPNEQKDKLQFKPSSVVIQQSNLIFKEVFEPSLGKSSFSSSTSVSKQIITKEKFERAITTYFGIEDDLQILRDLYARTDQQNNGYITKEQLIQAIQYDIQTSNQETSTTNKTNQSTQEQDEASIKEDDVLQASPDTLKRRLMNEGKEIANPKHDPILLWLLNHELNKKSTADPKASQNLAQVIEYVNNYKLEQYHNQLPSLQFLFEILLAQSQRACKQNESMQQQLEQMQRSFAMVDSKNRDWDSFRDYAMKDINAEVVKNLEFEVDRLKAFEMMYHAQQRKLEQQVSENHELEIERDNLQSINQDLLHDFEAVKKERDRHLAERKKDTIQIKEMTSLIQNLKEQVLNNFKRGNQNDEYANDLDDSDIQSNMSKLDDHESPLANIDTDRTNGAPQQPKRRQNHDDDEQDISMSDPSTNVLRSNSKHATQLEIQLLDDLETTEVFKMREQIQTYIRQHVWLEREGLKLQLKALNDTVRRNKKQLTKRDLEIMNLKSEVSTLKQLCQDQEDRYNKEVNNEDALKQQLMELTKQHQKINHEKSRLIGVNQLLEQKLKIERSEKMSMINDIEQIEMQEELQGAQIDANQSIVSGMSGVSRLSLKYSGQRGAGRMTSFIKQSKQNLSMRRTPHRREKNGLQSRLLGTARRDTDQQSINSQQALWIKNRVREGTDFDQYSQFQENALDPYYDIDFSQMSAIKSRRNRDDQLEMDSNRLNQSQSINMSHFQSQIIESNEDDKNRSSVILRAAGGKKIVSSFREGDEDGARVQVISDFDSQDNDDDKYSIEITSQNDLARINENIQMIQSSKMANNGAKEINYDLLGIRDPAHKLHQKIDVLIEKEFQMKDRRTQMAKSLKQVEGPIFSDKIHLYQNKKMKELLMIILQGNIYLVHEREKDEIAMQLKPFNFLDDITKIIYSERHTRYLALKLRDLRKFGDSDHLVIEVRNRELLADYMMEHAEKHEDDVVFELNEEFSMLIKYQPQWFSFDDVDRCKKQEQKMLFNSDKNTMTGFLELRQNKTMNIIKSLFRGQQAIWERKYFVLRGFRLHIFAVQKNENSYTKPERVITLSEGVSFKEARKAEVGGKLYVITICADQRVPEDQQEIIHAACSGSQMLLKWMSSLKKVQDLYNQANKIRQELEMEQQIQQTVLQNVNNSIKQSRFTATTNRNALVKAKSKTADQKVPSNGSSAMKNGEASPAKPYHNTGQISQDFNAFAMEQIMMADGVTGSLRLNLEKRMEQGAQQDMQSSAIDKIENVYGALTAAPCLEHQKDNESELIEKHADADDTKVEDPYDIIKQSTLPDVQSFQQSQVSETEPQPLQSNRERVRRGRNSRCSSRLNTSSKKEVTDVSKSSVSAAADDGANQNYNLENTNEELRLGNGLLAAGDQSFTSSRQMQQELRKERSERIPDKSYSSSILASRLINNPIGASFKSKVSREDPSDQLNPIHKFKQQAYHHNSGAKSSQLRLAGSPPVHQGSSTSFVERRKKYNRATEHVSQQPLTKLYRDEMGSRKVTIGSVASSAIDKKSKRNEQSPVKQSFKRS